MSKPEIIIKGLKTAEFASEETLCFEASIYVDGIRAFIAHNDGRGGCNMYDPINEVGKKLLVMYEKYAKTLPQYVTKWGSGDMDLDILIGDMVEEQLANKQLKGWCRKETLFRLPDDKEGSYRTVKEKFNPDVKTYIMNKYPNAIIMNEVV